MPFQWSKIDLETLRAHSTTHFRIGGGSRPDVLLIEMEGQRAVLKDQNGADRWFAKIIGPILNWRECKALNRLSDVSCVPKLLARPDSRSFLMSHHESQQITKIDQTNFDWVGFFSALEAAIEQLHAAGVAHNDLRNPTNTLVTPNGQPVLVDLVACFCKGSDWNIVNHWMFDKFTQVDRSAITKMKQRFAPHLINEDDVIASEIAGRPGMWIKALGQAVRRLSRRIFTDK